MIRRLWLSPPLAFARVGGSPVPCPSYRWEGSSGETQLAAAQTFEVGADGSLRESPVSAEPLVLKDAHGFRPVCPFFELHGEWDSAGGTHSGPVSDQVLGQFGFGRRDVSWSLHLANRKAQHFSRSEGDVVEARCELRGDDHGPRRLDGVSPAGHGEPLVLPERPMAMGMAQVIQPSPEFPGLRLRFTPPKGLVYAHTDIAARLKQIPPAGALEDEIRAATQGQAPDVVALLIGLAKELDQHNERWRPFDLGKVQAVMNPDAAWSRWAWPRPKEPLSLKSIFGIVSDPKRLGPVLALSSRGDQSQLLRHLIQAHEDAGNLPPGIFPFFVTPGSLLSGLGLLDDVSDGFVEVRLGELRARARVVVTPPSVAPDRRTPVSIADGLADRARRADAREPAWMSGANAEVADAEMLDLFERAFETLSLQNTTAMADFFRQENKGLVALHSQGKTPAEREQLEKDVQGKFWADGELSNENARAMHGHLRSSTDALKQLIQGYAERVRSPADDEPFYDKKMPALMRGFDRRPMTLTRRQYDLLMAWIDRLKNERPEAP